VAQMQGRPGYQDEWQYGKWQVSQGINYQSCQDEDELKDEEKG